jgi:uncharacterized protein YndB with AHSA1/START domain
MTGRSVTHGSFTIERSYDATPARVFKAWANPAAKARWFVGPSDWQLIDRSIDFKVGGKEHLSGKRTNFVSTFDGYYHDIVSDQRIIYSYHMHLDRKQISVSLATVEFKPEGAGSRLVFTEQAAFLDGFDDAGGREQGTRVLLEQLGSELKR